MVANFIICLVLLFGLSVCKSGHTNPNPDEIISRIEAVLGDGYKKQSITELAAALTYRDATNEGDKIRYYILKTTFYEGDPNKITGLYTEAIGVLFRAESMVSCEEMKIQGRDAPK